MNDILLQASGICKQFKGSEDLVLNNINIELYHGDFTIIMGPSGSGKSTLLYALSGMDCINSGEIYYKNQQISRLSQNALANLRSNEFGFVFSQTHLVSNLSLLENVAIPGFLSKNRTESEVLQRAELLLEQMNVLKEKDRFPHQVSGGQAQRAAIARAIISDPGIIFADEPTGALNKKSSLQVLNLLTDLHNAGHSILMVTHDLRSAIRGTRILYLEDGQIIDQLPLPPFNLAHEQQRQEYVSAWLTSVGW